MSLNHLKVGRGLASVSSHLKITLFPMVTTEGTWAVGLAAGTAQEERRGEAHRLGGQFGWHEVPRAQNGCRGKVIQAVLNLRQVSHLPKPGFEVVMSTPAPPTGSHGPSNHPFAAWNWDLHLVCGKSRQRAKQWVQLMTTAFTVQLPRLLNDCHKEGHKIGTGQNWKGLWQSSTRSLYSRQETLYHSGEMLVQ